MYLSIVEEYLSVEITHTLHVGLTLFRMGEGGVGGKKAPLPVFPLQLLQT